MNKNRIDIEEKGRTWESIDLCREALRAEVVEELGIDDLETSVEELLHYKYV